MAKPRLKFYPVGNGDTVLLTLSDKSTIIVDCKFREPCEDEEIFDVKSDLLSALQRDRHEIAHTDAFILTHPDQDHCLGFQKHFYTGDPSNYSAEDEENERIIIDELWFSNMLFNRFKAPLCTDAQALKKEAKRRMKLYEQNPSAAAKPGNRLRIIGSKDDPELKGFEGIISEPGTMVNLINRSIKNDFYFFVHAPFKTPTLDSQDRNETSVILQACFSVDGVTRSGIAFLAGDADYNRFARLLKERNNTSLEWDILLAPHHCSWTYYNMTPYEEFPNPQQTALTFLDKRRSQAWVVASSKSIVDDEDNPPHYPAKTEYVKKTGSSRFLCTADQPMKTIEFTISAHGVTRETSTVPASAVSSIGAATYQRSTYGNR